MSMFVFLLENSVPSQWIRFQAQYTLNCDLQTKLNCIDREL